MLALLRSHTIPWKLILVFLLLALGIGIAGHTYSENQLAFIKQNQQNELAAIADLKVSQLVGWRNERITDAQVILQEYALARSVQQWRANPADSGLQNDILTWMSFVRTSYDFEGIFLLDPQNRVLLSAPGQAVMDDADAPQLIARTLETRQVLLSDFHRNGPDGNIGLDLAIPLLVSAETTSPPVAILLIEIAADQFIFPLLQSWPTPSLSGETLLVEQDGNSIVYLNNLRHRKHSALTLRLPIDTAHLPASKAVLGYVGNVEGLDYRGVPVWAASRPIPDSPWFLIAKVDTAEITAPIEQHDRLIAIMVAALILAAGGGIGLVWRNQNAAFYRKQYKTELERKSLADQLSYLNQYANDMIKLMDYDGNIVQVNERSILTYGYSREEFLRMNVRDLRAPETRPFFNAQFKQTEEQDGMVFETVHQRKDGTTFPVEISSRIIEIGGKKFLMGISREITERKRADAALQESETNYKTLFESNPRPMWVYDRESLAVLAVNEAAIEHYGYSRDEFRAMTIVDLHAAALRPALLQAVKKIPGVLRKVGVWQQRKKDGTAIDVEITTHDLIFDGRPARLVMANDVTEKLRAEAALRESERIFRETLENVQLIAIAVDRRGRVTFCNDFVLELTGWPREQVIGKDWIENFLPSEIRRTVRRRFLEAVAAGENDLHIENEIQTRQGERRLISWNNTARRDAAGNLDSIISIGEDITERKKRESELQAIATVSAAMRLAPTRAEMLPIILDQLLNLLRTGGAALAMRDPATNEVVIELGRGDWTTWTGIRLEPGEGISGQVVATGRPYLSDDVTQDAQMTHVSLVGSLPNVACVPLTVQEQTIGALWIGSQVAITEAQVQLLTSIADIAANAIHRVTLYEQTKEHLQRLAALRRIDQAISGSLDLHVTLGVLLSEVTGQLGVDAANVLLLNPQVQVLELAAGKGFRTKAFENHRVRMGADYAGRAALERRTIEFKDWRSEIQLTTEIQSLTSALQTEGFIAFFVVPLITKGQVKGVLQIFHRAPLAPNQEWLDFLHSLAGQAAIAIDNATLFEGLENANTELSLAYDATIEGWSRALDLRDKETEGHSSRVTDMTLRLARALGVHDSEMIHLRRGALLHDIGKMAIPDHILLKPGPLTVEEQVTMRRHPAVALELLSPIEYLRQALDIPYCHHEKWDGAGYPRGLKGEQIPFAARIFAVADVWDALRSDRPYRLAWPDDKVCAHIQAEAGKHFDPQVVKAFLELTQPAFDYAQE